MKKKITNAICIVLLLIPAVLAVAPLLFLLTGSVMDTSEIREYIGPVLGDGEGFAVWRLFPMYPTLVNVIELFFDSPEFFQMFWNSMKITAGILTGQLLFGMPAAWGLAQYEFPGKRAVYFSYIVLMLMPFQVTMLSEYIVLDLLGLTDTLSAVILPGMFLTFPPFLMYRFFSEIPPALIEAARVDGAGELAVFFRIGIPVGSSGIISALVLQFLECQSMVEQPLIFLKTKRLWPLSLYLPEVDLSHAGSALCASFVALVPALFVFLYGQDYLEQGIVASAIKE